MDSATFFLISKLQNNHVFTFNDFVIFLMMVIIPKLLSLTDTFHETMIYIREKIDKKLYNYKYLDIDGQENIATNGEFILNYSEAYISLSWYLGIKNEKDYLKAYDSNDNEGFYYRAKNDINDSQTEYIVKDIPEYKKIDTGVEVILYKEVNQVGSKKNEFSSSNISKSETITLRLRSINVDLQIYLDNIISKYNAAMKEKNKNNIYHFIFQGSYDERLSFNKYILDDHTKELNYESFDNIFHEHKDILINDLKKLKDLEYYKRTGLKRKKGYLFYGQSGSGKTSSVMAMSKEDNRHIIEIPMSRVKTNAELEQIINITKIEDVTFTKDQIILLFDEIDICADDLKDRSKKFDLEKKSKKKSRRTRQIQNKNQNQKNQKNLKDMKDPVESEHDPDTDSGNEFTLEDLNLLKVSIKTDDALNLGSMLSRLDGIGNYNGLVIIATTNYKDSLDASLYRDLRLTPLYFTYARQIDIINMIEKYYNCKLHRDLIKLVPDISKEITPAKIRVLLEQYKNESEFIKHLETF